MVALIFILVGALQNTLTIFLTAAFVLALGVPDRFAAFMASAIIIDMVLGVFMLGNLTSGLVAGRWWGVITGLLMAVATVLLVPGPIATYTTVVPGDMLVVAALAGAIGGLLLYIALRIYNNIIERAEGR